MWEHFPDGLSAEGAKSKRPVVDAPIQQPMRANLKPAQQRKPSADQKRVRRQMARQAAEDTYGPRGYRVLGCAECGNPVAGDYDRAQCLKCGATYTPLDKADATALGLRENEVVRLSLGERYVVAVPYSSVFASSTSTTTSKEITAMSQQPTEAHLIQRLAQATTLVEQAAIQTQIETLRAARREHVAASDALDWDGMGVLPPTREQRMAQSLLGGTAALPGATGSMRMGTTDATDWLADLTPSDTPDPVLSATARAEAVRWFEGLWSAVKQTPEEFSVQAKNAAARIGTQYGLQSTAAASVFLDQVAHLASREGIAFTAAEYAGGSPKHGDTAVCHADGKPIEFFDGQWMHYAGGPSHNDVYPGTPKEVADGVAMGSRHHALDETVDTYVSDGRTTQPVGVEPETDSLDEWTIGTDLNGGEDPKSTNSANAPSLSEGDAPEQATDEGIENPNFGQSGVDKSTFNVGNTDDKMSTQGGRRTAGHAYDNGDPIGGGWGSHDVPCRECGKPANDPAHLFGTDGRYSASKRTAAYECGYCAGTGRVSNGAPGMDLGPGFPAFLDCPMCKGTGEVSTTRDRDRKPYRMSALSIEAQMAAEFGSPAGRGIQTYAQEEQSTSADGLSSARAPEDAPSMSEGDEVEGDHSESATQEPGQGAQDLSQARPTDNLHGVNWGSTAARRTAAAPGEKVKKTDLVVGDAYEEDGRKFHVVFNDGKDLSIADFGGNGYWDTADSTLVTYLGTADEVMGLPNFASSRSTAARAQRVASGTCWCGKPAAYKVPVDPEVTNPNTEMGDGQPGLLVCEEHMDKDGYEKVGSRKHASDRDEGYAQGKADLPSGKRSGDYSESERSAHSAEWWAGYEEAIEDGYAQSRAREGSRRQPSHTLSAIASSFAGKPVSPTVATLAQGLSRCASMNDAVGSVSARQIVAALARSAEAPLNVRLALAEHLALQVGDMVAYESTCPNSSCEEHGTAFVRDDLFQSDDEEALCPVCDTPLVSTSTTASRRTAGDSVKVQTIPECDICKYEQNRPGIPAAYDGKTVMGPWANMCEAHFSTHGVGLGTGRGQRLVQASRRHANGDAVEAQSTCKVCGDAIAKDGDSYHHDNGEKHDHEAQPGGESKEGRRAPFSREAADDRKRHSTTCPKCSAQMDDVTVSGDTLTARCDKCGWSGSKTKTAAAPWPMKDNPNFPGEQMPACPTCGGNVVMEGTPLSQKGKGPMGTTLVCENGHRTYFPNKTAARRTAGNSAVAEESSKKHTQTDRGDGYWTATCKNCGGGLRRKDMASSGWTHSKTNTKWCPEGEAKESRLTSFASRVQAGLSRVVAEADALGVSLREGDIVEVTSGDSGGRVDEGVVQGFFGGEVLVSFDDSNASYIHPSRLVRVASRRVEDQPLFNASRRTAADHSRCEHRQGYCEVLKNAPADTFSLSDAKNEDGEWIMSPEQIRAEMYYSEDPGDAQDRWYAEGSRTASPSRYDGGGAWKAQVAGNGESTWSGNGVTFDTPEEAKAWIADLSMKWFGFDLGRVVPADTPTGEPVDLSDPQITHNFR